jgi:hypothetical protein
VHSACWVYRPPSRTRRAPSASAHLIDWLTTGPKRALPLNARVRSFSGRPGVVAGDRLDRFRNVSRRRGEQVTTSVLQPNAM